MRYCAVAAATPDDTTALPAQRWWRGQDPDPVVVRRMLVDEGRTEVEIAAAMKISGARLAAVLTELGVDRGGRVRRVCPVGDADLRVLLEQGATVASLAHRFSVAKVTVQRWLAGAGLLLADPAVDVDALSRLYVEQGLTIGEVAAALGLPRARVEVALAVAGSRPGAAGWQRTGARQTYAPLPLTAGLLTALYLDVGLATSDIALLCGVGNNMVSSGLHEHNVELRPAKIASPWKQRLAPPRKAAGRHRACRDRPGEQTPTRLRAEVEPRRRRRWQALPALLAALGLGSSLTHGAQPQGWLSGPGHDEGRLGLRRGGRGRRCCRRGRLRRWRCAAGPRPAAPGGSRWCGPAAPHAAGGCAVHSRAARRAAAQRQRVWAGVPGRRSRFGTRARG